MAKFIINASHVRRAVKVMADSGRKADAAALLLALCPKMTAAVAGLIVNYPDETTVNGSALVTPASWDSLTAPKR